MLKEAFWEAIASVRDWAEVIAPRVAGSKYLICIVIGWCYLTKSSAENVRCYAWNSLIVEASCN